MNFDIAVSLIQNNIFVIGALDTNRVALNFSKFSQINAWQNRC